MGDWGQQKWSDWPEITELRWHWFKIIVDSFIPFLLPKKDLKVIILKKWCPRGFFCAPAMVNLPSLASGPLHVLLLSPGTTFPFLIPPCPLGFCLDITSSGKPSLTLPPSLSPKSALKALPVRFQGTLFFPSVQSPFPTFFKLLIILSFLSSFSWGQIRVHLVHRYSFSREHPLGTKRSGSNCFFLNDWWIELLGENKDYIHIWYLENINLYF